MVGVVAENDGTHIYSVDSAVLRMQMPGPDNCSQRQRYTVADGKDFENVLNACAHCDRSLLN